MKAQLLKKIQNRTAIVAVVGVGYVGLPLVTAFGQAGFRVIALDLDSGKVQAIREKRSYIPDIESGDIAELVEAGRLTATTDYADIAEADAIIICVPTPLRKTKDPDMSFIINAADSIAEVRKPNALIVLESTTYPGTTEEILVPRMVKGSGEGDPLTVGEDLFIAFSPERIDPSNPVYGVKNTPKVIGGLTPASQEVVQALYCTAIEKVVPVSSPAAAEMVKLLENTFRAVNIGLVNEVAIMCDKLGIDVWEVIEAASTKPFGFMPFYPGPGLGGHCIPIDPLYLSWKLKSLNYNARFIELASEIWTSMPIYTVELIIDALNSTKKPVNGSKIGVLGVAYKSNVNDLRESPAIDIIHMLRSKGAAVSYHDPYIPSADFEGFELDSVELTDKWLHDQDAVVIVTHHDLFDWQYIMDQAALIIDTRNATAGLSGKANVFRIGDGRRAEDFLRK